MVGCRSLAPSSKQLLLTSKGARCGVVDVIHQVKGFPLPLGGTSFPRASGVRLRKKKGGNAEEHRQLEVFSKPDRTNPDFLSRISAQNNPDCWFVEFYPSGRYLTVARERVTQRILWVWPQLQRDHSPSPPWFLQLSSHPP